MGAIYRAICKANGKVYVGQTICSGWKQAYRTRWSGARARARKGYRIPVWQSAMNKYGRAGFEFRDLMTNVNPRDLDALEIFFIKHFQATNLAKGYNLELGGNGHKVMAERTRAILRSRPTEAKKYRWYHKTHGEIVASVFVLSSRFLVSQTCLRLLAAGKSRSSSGWVCLEAPQRIGATRGCVAVWGHPRYGEFVGDARSLTLRCPDLRINAECLRKVLKGTSATHRGWKFLRRPTIDEDVEARRWWADNGSLGAYHRKFPRVS